MSPLPHSASPSAAGVMQTTPSTFTPPLSGTPGAPLSAARTAAELHRFTCDGPERMRPVEPGPGRLLLVRHGETLWSRDGRHTGLTDLPLTDAGRRRATGLPTLLGAHRIVHVRSSPLQRAAETLHLAGRTPDTYDADLAEWDYGAEEGRTTAEARRDGRPGWTVFDGVPPGDTPGETVEMVAARASRVLGRVWGHLEHGDVLLVGHGHHLRVLAAVYLRQTPYLADSLEFEAGSLCVLGHHRDTPTIQQWNRMP
ncbi:histidine phosphatase family protein [Kytococcus sedentarius]|uniref:histidine phosphatase family protein n=1 Tax=Kytococcus sedentarius TaxID=1276 RepID=UPI0035BC18D3